MIQQRLLIDPVPGLEVEKTASVTDEGDGFVGAGDVINYTITVRNIGNVTLTGLTVSDTLTDGNSSTLNMSTGPSFSGSDAGSNSGMLLAGETATYIAYYIISDAAAATGRIVNIAQATASSPGQSNDVTDISDDPNTAEENDATAVEINPTPEIQITKSVSVQDINSSGDNDIGDIVTYTILVENTGSVPLTNIIITDTFTDGNGGVLNLTGPELTANTVGSSTSTLAVGGILTYTATYTIQQAAAYTGSIVNVANVTASSPGNNGDITDVSDDPNTAEPNDATTIETFPRASFEVVKTFSITQNDGNTNNNANDQINYVITITNTGSVTISDLNLNDSITDGNGGNLALSSGPTFSGATAGSTSTNLAVSGVVSYTATYVISQDAANTGRIINSVTVVGSTPAGSGDISDVSDNGDDNDGNTTNDSTIVETISDVSVQITKSSSVVDVNSNGKTDTGDQINYTIVLTNTGNALLSDISISDTLTDGAGNTLSLTTAPTFVSASAGSTSVTLEAGDQATFSASYVIEQSAANTGSVINRATVTASSPGNTNDVTDTSDDPNTAEADDATIVSITPTPAVEVTKTVAVVENGDGDLGLGDTVRYTIVIENKGNVPLTSIVISDTFTDSLGNVMSLTTTPSFDFSDLGSNEGSIAPGEKAYYIATFEVDQASIDAGGLLNQATVTVSSTGGQVSDTSDDGIDGDGNTVDDVTELVIDHDPVILVTKTASVNDIDSDGNNLNDVITYTITVENQGNVTLNDLTLTDTLTDGNDQGLTLDSGPTFVSATASSTSTTLQVGGTATFTAVYTIDQQAVDSGRVLNSALGVASSPSGNSDTSDTSDDGDDSDGDIDDDPTIVTLTATPSIDVSKSASLVDPNNNGADLGDTIVYTITVTNTGDLTLTGVGISDTITDGNGGALSLSSGPTLTSGNAASLDVGASLTYSATFVINQPAVDSGSVINVANITASSPGQTRNVSGTSDDPDTIAQDDPTVVTISSNPLIEVLKSVQITDNGDGVTGKGDIARYTITVQNTGDITLNNITVSDTLTDLNGNTLNLDSGPSFSGSDQGSAQGSLKPSETATYIGLYIINQSAVDNGGISNVAQAISGSVSDTSDDPNTAEADDATVTTITASPSLEVTKSAIVTDNDQDGATGAGDIINYTITVRNTGNITLSGITISDTLTDGLGNSLTLGNPGGNPQYSSTSMGSAVGTIKPEETQTYTAFYVISPSAAGTSKIVNSAIVTASSPGQTNNVSDTSDDPNTAEADDATEVSITPNPSIEATKTQVVSDTNGSGLNDTGDIIIYTIEIENTGNVTLTSISLDDTITDHNGNALSLDGGPTFVSSSNGSPAGTLGSAEIATYTASYTIGSAAAYSGSVRNRVIVTSSSPGNTDDVIDISDNGDDDDGNRFNDFTVVQTTAQASIEVIKTATVSDTNANNLTDAGDIIIYQVGVTNTGGVNLDSLTFTDNLTDGNGGALNLDAPLTFVSATTSSTSTTIVPSGVVTYTANYTIANDASYTGSIVNSAEARANVEGTNNQVNDQSDDPTTPQANDPTEVAIDPVPGLEVEKTASVTDEGDGFVGAGDVINYTITVRNIGNVTLTGLTVSDTLTDGEWG